MSLNLFNTFWSQHTGEMINNATGNNNKTLTEYIAFTRLMAEEWPVNIDWEWSVFNTNVAQTIAQYKLDNTDMSKTIISYSSCAVRPISQRITLYVYMCLCIFRCCFEFDTIQKLSFSTSVLKKYDLRVVLHSSKYTYLKHREYFDFQVKISSLGNRSCFRLESLGCFFFFVGKFDIFIRGVGIFLRKCEILHVLHEIQYINICSRECDPKS